MLDKGLARIVTRFLGDFDHLGADSCDFAQADLVDIVRRPFGGRHLADTEVIIFRAARLRRNARCLGAVRGIVFHVPVEMLLHRGVDDAGDGPGGFCRQLVERRLVYSLGPLAQERLIETRLLGLVGDQTGNAGFIANHRDAGLDIAARQCLVGDRDRLIIDHGILFQPVDIGPVILCVPERQIVLHTGEILVPATAIGEIDRALAIAVRLNLLSQRPSQDAIVGFVVFAQRLGVDHLQLCQP